MPELQNPTAGKPGPLGRIFVEHPRSLGMSWLSHGVGALKIGGELIAAGGACLIHAFVPALFTQTAGKTVTRMYEHMTSRRSGASNPETWPDYEI